MPLPGDWRDWLSLDEIARAEAFGSDARREAFVAGRIALRGLAGERLGVPPSAVPLRREDDGALTIDGSPLHVSISHSGAWAVATLGEVQHAIDIERIRSVAPGLADRIAEPGEVAALARSLPEPVLAVWCAKEAVLKARRSGFRLAAKSLRLIRFQPTTLGEASGVRATATGPDEATWAVRITLAAGYVLALAQED